MPIEPGIKLGHYEIVEPIGAGGMGEVYRARDTRLERTVAVKVLPQHLSDNAELRQRFEQEARAVSSLNHPNICTLHDIGRDNGVDFMVMEFIEGETLSDRLQKGALPLDEALRTASAIGDALDKAHRKGITHRDVKPGNVMLTPSGPKLLDFGLAKFQSRSAQEPDLSAVTEQKPLTEKGAILGTFQYMAPEQLEGGDTDARTDIFAFGALLYEMVTGHKAFSGKSQASLISAIMSSEPRPISELQPATPKGIDRIVRRCLAKDPEDRWQSARDVVLELASGEDRDLTEASTSAPRSGERLVWAGMVLAAAAIAGIWVKSSTPPPLETTRAVIPLPPGYQLLGGSSLFGSVSSVDISPDGRTVAYVAERGGDSQLFLRPLDAFESTPVSGTEQAVAPIFSPDGQWIAFSARGEVRKTALTGTAVVRILERSPGMAFDASWGDDGNIVIGGPHLTRVSADGGGTSSKFGGGAAPRFRWPQILPGGRHVIVTIPGAPTRVAIVSTESGNVRTLLEGYGGARYISSGHLIVRDLETANLRAVAFELDALEVKGAPISVVDDVYISPRTGLPHFAVSDTGVLIYVPGGLGTNALVWVDRRGNVVDALSIARGAYGHAQLSPDGLRVALDNLTGPGREIWVHDLARGTRIRLTDNDRSAYPKWTPDGTRVSFSSQEKGPNSILRRVVDASADAEVLLGGGDYYRIPTSWSPDGSTLAYEEGQPAGDRDIFVLLPGGESRPFVSTSFDELSPMFSPDGRFLAYVSDESGRPEVYVRPYPEGDQKWTISSDGGAEPVWSRDGRELFYRNDYKMMVVLVESGSTFRAERPRLLFEAPYFTDAAGHPGYDVSPDGKRFLMIQDSEDEGTQINVVFNWFEELKRLVPTE